MNPPGVKRSIYMPSEMYAELEYESLRLQRSVSWLIQYAWKRTELEVSKLQPPETTAREPAN